MTETISTNSTDIQVSWNRLRTRQELREFVGGLFAKLNEQGGEDIEL